MKKQSLLSVISISMLLSGCVIASPGNGYPDANDSSYSHETANSGNKAHHKKHASRENRTAFFCENGAYSFDLVRHNNGKVTVINGAGERSVLKQAPSASGEHYVSNQYDLYLKGNEGMITYKDNGQSYPHRNCIAK